MIFAPKMSEIVVEFDSFDMEPDTTPPPGAQCRYDFLEIWDGFPAGEVQVAGLQFISVYLKHSRNSCQRQESFLKTNGS